VSGRWIERVKATPLDRLAPAVGLTLGRLGSFGPCPACGEERRGSDDRRGACGMASDRRGWQCHRCRVRGDALDLLALVQHGVRSDALAKPQWADLREWCVARGLADQVDTSPAPPVRSTAGLTQRLMGEHARQGAERARGGAGAPDMPSSATGATQGAGGAFAWREGLAEDCAAALWDCQPDGGSRQADAVLAWLRSERRFTDETIRAWGLGCIMVRGEPWLTIPLRDEAERIVNVRFRSVPPAGKTYRVCPGRPLPLFGSHLLGNDLGQVIVTEGELDVIALWQYGLTSSVVSGTAGSDTMKDEWLDQLEPYEGFVLAYDNDEAGERGAARFAEKMGLERCSRAVLPHNDAGECLRQGVPAESVYRVLDRAHAMFGVGFKRVSAYTAGIERLINHPEELMGRSTGSARMDRCLGGLRPGLMIVSGDTGHGKSTWATWLLWMQARAGTPVLMTSFEQRPIGTVQKLLRMQLGGDFTQVEAQTRTQALDELGDLPIHMLDHYGNMKPEALFQALRYAVRRLGAQVVLVDHLGFLLDPTGDDKVGQIEAIIRALALTAKTLGITIVLVCHPRGLPQGAERVTINDLKGASAIKQDADEVVVVVRDPPRTKGKDRRNWPAAWLHFDKVRSEFGVPGSRALLAFGALSCCYADDWSATPEGRAGLLLVEQG
jgi:archaellum biogenesis ATPase FlaH/5S rRNA maturation endonuclease (ribonuclease M5)